MRPLKKITKTFGGLGLACICLLAFSASAFGQTCNGGSVMTQNGEDTVNICIDGQADVVNFDSMSTAGDYRYLITDATDTILMVKTSDFQDFNRAGPGECHVYGLSYDGTLNASAGMHISDVSASNCSDLSSNQITVWRDTIQGGQVQTTGNEDTVYACIDGQDDVYSFMNTSQTMAMNYKYIVTDANNDILKVKDNNMQNFDPAGPGECHVHGIAYLGDLNASQGMNISNVTASDCYERSDNHVTVWRDTIQGAQVQTTGNEDTVYACIDGQDDVYSFMNTSQTMAMNYKYIVTDANNDILKVKDNNMQNFDPAGPGECHVHGIAYLGDLNASQGMNISNVTASDCYERSDNHITVWRDTIQGGQVQTTGNEDTVYACIDGQDDVYSFMNTSQTMAMNYKYIVTDANDDILKVKDNNMQNFDPAGPGECHVHGIAYLGNLDAGQGMNISNVSASDCHELSDNHVTVFRDTMEGGMVQTANGEDSITVIIDDNPDNVSFMNTSETMSMNYSYVITNANDTILKPDAGDMQNFNPAGVGKCYVYGFAHLGKLNASKDMAISNVMASECHEQSSNRIVVKRMDTMSSSVGAIGQQNGQLEVHPNPAKDKISINLQEVSSERFSMELRNLSGQVVMEKTIDSSRGTVQNLNLPDGLNGLYLLLVKTDSSILTKKLRVRK